MKVFRLNDVLEESRQNNIRILPFAFGICIFVSFRGSIVSKISSVRKDYVLGRLCTRLWLANFSFLLQRSLHLTIAMKKETIHISWALSLFMSNKVTVCK